jgi:hypothetical protein
VRAESEVHREAIVRGPGRPGFVEISLGSPRGFPGERTAEVARERVPELLRMPQTPVVAVTSADGVLRVEGRTPGALRRLALERSVRRLLDEWDPIGVAAEVDGEYDSYIGGVLGLLRAGADEHAIAEHLLAIERERMGLPGTPIDRRLSVASGLRRLDVRCGMR